MWLLSFMPCQMVASLDSFSCCFLVGFVSSIFLLPFLPFFPFLTEATLPDGIWLYNDCVCVGVLCSCIYVTV